ncbi:MAG: 3-phosphoserine/phosphohydroxythreonine transaminase [Oscillospiraceae bacterium]
MKQKIRYNDEISHILETGGISQMDRVYNFSAGPSMLPLPVLEQAQRDLVNYPGAGCSVMEMSHRSRAFEDILKRAEASLRRLMHIPDTYSVLFLQGGASLQFSMVPMNLAQRGQTTAYAVTGQFAKKAFEEGKRWGNAVAVTNGKPSNFSAIPAIEPSLVPADAAYLHITVNNTIFGTCYNTLPDVGNIPLVGDMSSIITGKEFDVSRFALIYAGAQKNMAPAGVTVVIVRNDMVPDKLDSVVPTMLSYQEMIAGGSMYNTPPCWCIYMAGLVYEWLESQGGVAAIEKKNTEKAMLLYNALDESELFSTPARPEDRSIMNVTFTLPDEDMTRDFLKLVEGRGLVNLKGHRSVGGFRASIYNAMPYEGVAALVSCIKDFTAGRRA